MAYPSILTAGPMPYRQRHHATIMSQMGSNKLTLWHWP